MNEQNRGKIIWSFILMIIGFTIMLSGIGIPFGYIIGHHGVVLFQQAYKD